MKLVVWLMLATLWMVQAVGAVCPPACKCSRKSGPDRSEVNCHKRGLRAFPSNLPSDAWILKFGENRIKSSWRTDECVNKRPLLVFEGENGITELQANALRSAPSIESMNLERNAIKSIHPQALSGAKKLMLLNLYGNHISRLPLKGFQVNPPGAIVIFGMWHQSHDNNVTFHICRSS